MTKQRTGDELIVFDDMPIGKSLGDYWRWNASDLLRSTPSAADTMNSQ